MQLSLSGFLFEDNYTDQSVSFEEFCRIASSAGYQGVELRRSQITPDTPQAQRRQMLAIVKEHGLSVTCLTARGLPTDGPPRDSFFAGYLELCRELGCRLMKISGDSTWLRDAASRAAEAEVALAANNHIGARTETVAGAVEYLREIGHPNYGLLYDSLHLMVKGEDYLGGVDALFPYIRNVLVQCVRPAAAGESPSLTVDRRDFVKARIDDPGVQNWRTIIEKLKALRYRGQVTVIENGWPQDQRKQIAAGTAEYLIDLWNQC